MKLDKSVFEQFDRDGYIVIQGLLDVRLDIEPVVHEYEALLDRLAHQCHQEGRLSSTYAGLPFAERLIKIVTEAEPAYDVYFDISLPKANITEQTPMHHGPAVFDLLRNERLLEAVEQFVGPEIYSSPVGHTRVKLPEHILPKALRTGLSAQNDWHQDLGVITDEANDCDILTVWFPVTQATVENGCLAVVPGSHRGELTLHCRSKNPLTLNQACIPQRLLFNEGLPVPMDPGDVLFMHRKTQHCGLPNRSNEVRWSFDLRYQPIGQPTGRPWFPGFVARSREQPDSELTDASRWADLWREARSELARTGDVAFDRWKQGDPLCA